MSTVLPVELRPKSVRLFANSAAQDAVAAAKARDLIARGRKVRFVVKIDKSGRVEVEALDGDPWAAGWQMYGQRLWFEQHPWMAYTVASMASLAFLLGMWRKDK
jgi:hypothetical protein